MISDARLDEVVGRVLDQERLGGFPECRGDGGFESGPHPQLTGERALDPAKPGLQDVPGCVFPFQAELQRLKAGCEGVAPADAFVDF